MSNETMSNAPRNNSIDIFRLICAILVIIIHTSPFYDIDQNFGFFIHQVITRVAVPFFFAVSGFYYIGSLLKGKRIFWDYTKKLLTVYVVWSALYFLIDFVHTINSGAFSFFSFVKSCIVKFFIYGSHYHFWFFPALFLSVITVTVLYKVSNQFGFSILFAVGVIFYIIGCLGCSYFELAIELPILSSLVMSTRFEIIRRYLLMGIPFFLLGGFLNTQKNHFKDKLKYQLVFFVTSLALFLTEIYIVTVTEIYENLVLTFMLYPLVASIIILLVSNPMTGADKLGEFSRSCANFVYYSHPAIILLINVIFNLKSHTLLFIFTTIVTVGCGWILNMLGVRDKIFKVFNAGVKKWDFSQTRHL